MRSLACVARVTSRLLQHRGGGRCCRDRSAKCTGGPSSGAHFSLCRMNVNVRQRLSFKLLFYSEKHWPHMDFPVSPHIIAVTLNPQIGQTSESQHIFDELHQDTSNTLVSTGPANATTEVGGYATGPHTSNSCTHVLASLSTTPLSALCIRRSR